MIGEEAAALEESLVKVRKACGVIKIFCMCAFVFFFIMGVLLLFTEFSAGSFNILRIINTVVYIAGSLVISWLAMSIFSDISKNQTPFSNKQVYRIRGIALCFFAFTAMDFIFSPAFFGLYPVGQADVGFTNQADSGLQATVDLNVMTLMMALLTYFFSVAFKYGALLQSNVDDML